MRTTPPRPSCTRPRCTRPSCAAALAWASGLVAAALGLAPAHASPPAPAGSVSRAPPVRLPAFPGAEGWGAAATGGRGGRVITVTHLGARGPGSLQAALDAEGPRTVVFAVGGLIDAPIHLTRGDVTIAGQTAPGGITLRQLHTTEAPYCDHDPECIRTARRAENWIAQHIRIRPDGRHDDGLRLRYTRRAILDHVSIAGATDEAVEISYANQITIQNSIIAETVGDHASLGGVLINYSNPARGFELTQIALHHNLWHRLGGRLPELSRESAAAAGSVMDIEVSYNLYWDPGYYIDIHHTTVSASDAGAPIYYRLNLVGNLAVVRGPELPDPFPYGLVHVATPLPDGRGAPRTRTWLHDNRLSTHPTRRDYDLMYCCNDYATGFERHPPPAFAAAARHAFPPITAHAPETLAARAVAEVGAFPRDPLDRRLLGPVSRGRIDPKPRDRNPAGDGSALPTGPFPRAPKDTDGDGLPDAWERTHGLDPAVADQNGTHLSAQLVGIAGYTHLECYLHLLALQRLAEAK